MANRRLMILNKFLKPQSHTKKLGSTSLSLSLPSTFQNILIFFNTTISSSSSDTKFKSLLQQKNHQPIRLSIFLFLQGWGQEPEEDTDPQRENLRTASYVLGDSDVVYSNRDQSFYVRFSNPHWEEVVLAWDLSDPKSPKRNLNIDLPWGAVFGGEFTDAKFYLVESSEKGMLLVMSDLYRPNPKDTSE